MLPTRLLVSLLLSMLFWLPLLADEPPAEEAGADTVSDIEEQQSVTRHTVRIGGKQVAYTATAGTLLLSEEQGDSKAAVFYIAYTKDDEEPGQRPVTFSFNGGPGSSSVWLHLGIFGPRLVKMDPEGFPLPPPGELVDNAFSILDVTDLVFIDPVTTGYSRAVPGQDDKQFHGVDEDVAAVGEFIRLWTVRNARWASPKFLAGESYGTTRAAALSGWLQDRPGMYLNGIVLVSSILNFQTARFDTGNDLPYILFLPTYTAVAWYHERLPDDLQQRPLAEVVAEAREFAAGTYASALMVGDNLGDAKRRTIVQRLARYTGLSETYIEQTNLRVHIRRFVKELTRDEGHTVGRLDARFTGIDRDDAGEGYEYDPSYAAILGPFSGALNDYLRRELEFESDLPYEILTGRVHPWSFKGYENRYVNVAETLRRAMTRNRNLEVHVANGYYDLATPFFATEYTFDHLGLPAELRDNVSMSYYESGHMMYIRQDDLETMSETVREFMESTLSD